MQTTLQGWRTHKGYTQKEIARKLGVSEPTYIKWEKNPNLIRVQTLHDFSKILDISIEDVIFFEGESKFNLGKKESIS